MECAVIGAGVSGLTCALRLLENGHIVTIYSNKFSPNTVSDVAAAILYPFLSYPIKKTNKWSLETYSELFKISLNSPESGVTIRKGREFLRDKISPPDWTKGIDGFRILENNELVNDYIFGWEFEAPVIQMNLYMPWINDKLIKMGCRFNEVDVEYFSEIEENIIINCVGLGARELCNDLEVKPIRGQVIYIQQDPGIGRFDQQPETLTYTIPRDDVTVLGGTAQVNDWSMKIRDEDTEDILIKCESLWPELDRNNIIGFSVGLRPARHEVRLEKEYFFDKLIIHNYGHGGSGVTLSWGCADEVMKILERN
jgi:D-amino-acid oxidase